MADFWQGSIPTFSRLQEGQGDLLASRLGKDSGAREVTLLLPCHAKELRTSAFEMMLEKLREVTWLRRIVVGLDQAAEGDHEETKRRFSVLPIETHVLWLDGPEWRSRIPAAPFPSSGKGRNVWLSLGWILNETDAEIIALHDCDISPYDPELLARLVYPVARPEMGFRFCKGFYARFSHQLHGRLTRLLFQPLVKALASFDDPFATTPNVMPFLSEFRYPLAGEVAFDASLARQMRFLPGWSLETGMLAEVARLVPNDQICQAELCARYDHRHQPLQGNAGGLVDAAEEISRTLLQLTGHMPTELIPNYESLASDALRHFQQLSVMNGLTFDEIAEAEAIATFKKLLAKILSEPAAPQLPWLPAVRLLRSA